MGLTLAGCGRVSFELHASSDAATEAGQGLDASGESGTDSGTDASGTADGATDGGTEGGTDAGRSCTTPSSSCWDIWAVHTKTQWEREANHIFEQQVSDGERVYELFDGSDDTPTPMDENVMCPGFGNVGTRPQGWEVWRTKVDADTYRIQVYGRSDGDCGMGQPVGAGEIQIATDRWSITSVAKCTARKDLMRSNEELIETWCTVEEGAGNVSWQAGSTCHKCCRCADGAKVDIEFTVQRN